VIDPGILNRRLTLEAPVSTPDGQGGSTRIFNAVSTIWASIIPSGARDAFDADARGVNISHRIVVRRNALVTPQHRLRDGAAIFRILAMREDTSRQFLHIDAERRID
jgi:SPP1 family predicted phage head-tail adaptor